LQTQKLLLTAVPVPISHLFVCSRPNAARGHLPNQITSVRNWLVAYCI